METKTDQVSMNGSVTQMQSLIKCMADRDVMSLVRAEKGLSVDRAIQGKKNFELIKLHGEPTMVKAYSGVILMALDFFNTGQMSEIQAIQTASLLLEQYPYETIEDMILCLKNAKLGRYGKIFNRIDGQIIFEWFRLYLDEKYERFEQIKHNEKISEREALSEKIMPFADAILNAAEHSTTDKSIPTQRVTDKTHFEEFNKLLSSLNEDELKTLKDQYEKENKKYLYLKFDNYINAIDQKLQSS